MIFTGDERAKLATDALRRSLGLPSKKKVRKKKHGTRVKKAQDGAYRKTSRESRQMGIS